MTGTRAKRWVLVPDAIPMEVREGDEYGRTVARVNDAVRLTIRHADGLFERWRTGVEDWTRPDRTVRSVVPLQGA